MRYLISLVFLGVTVVSAADFRTVDVGDSCEPVRSREEALASTSIPWDVSSDVIIAFRGYDFDRKLMFTYFCPKGHLFAGNYYFPVQASAEALATYHEVYQRLGALYGAPFLDSSDLEPDQLYRAKDSDKYFTIWRTSRVEVTMSLMPNLVNESPGRRVFVVVSKAPGRI